MAGTATIKPREAVVPEFGRKIRNARYSVGEDRFIVTFDSGKEYSFSRSSLAVDDGSELVNVQLDRGRFFFRVTQASGNRYEVPWDRFLHESEPGYRYYRGRMDRTKAGRELGARIRKMRETKGLTQEALADAVGMMRSNISRIEAGKHHPTLDTLERIAKALKVPVAEIIAAR